MSSPSLFFEPRTRGGRPLLLGSDGWCLCVCVSFSDLGLTIRREATDLEPGAESKTDVDMVGQILQNAAGTREAQVDNQRWAEFDELKEVTNSTASV